MKAGSMEQLCPLRVFRYTGPYEFGSVPFELFDATVQDTAYVDSIVFGQALSAEAEEDMPGSKEDASGETSSVPGHTLAFDMMSDSGTPGWQRSCWPGNCGAGGGPWKKRRGTLIAGLKGRWQEYVVIEYYFDPTLDSARRSAFRKAVAAWSKETCIHFVETAVPAPAPSLQVNAKDAAHCYVSNIGYPGDTVWTTVNMGWCDSERYVGNLIHELGHVLGMNHEQKRPDAVQEYHGQGPHLIVNWNVVKEQGWLDQYQPDPETYVGSQNDGIGDPFIGLAPYDFGSIMHYPAGNHFETIPREGAKLTGNRRSLSEGDIVQVLDLYQCKERSR